MNGNHQGCRDGAAKLAATLLALMPTVASAEPSALPTTRLEFTIDRSALGCPTDVVLRAAVATHLGYDPFRDDGSWLVRAHIQASSTELSGSIDITDETGAPLGGRTLHTPTGECRDLVESMALVTSLALDPVTNPRSPAKPPLPPAAPLPEPPPALPAPPVVASVPATPRELPGTPTPTPQFTPYFVGALHGSIGGTPALAFGLSVGAGAERGWGSLGIEGRIDLPSEVTGPVGGVEATRAAVLLVGCVASRRAVVHMMLSGCAVGGGGPIWSHGVDVAQNNPRVDAHLEVGLRGRAAWILSDLVTVGLRAEVLVALTHTELSVEVGTTQDPVWRSLPVVVAVGPDISVHFR